MRKISIISVVGIALVLSGCATSYQPQGLTGGFSETQLDTNMYRVTFEGNGFTDRQRSQDFTLLRSAELTLQHGYKYFVIINANQSSRYSSYTTPSRTNVDATVYGNSISGTATTYGGHTEVITKPSNSNTFVMYKTKPKSFSYNAKFIIASLKNQYKLNKPTKNN